MTPLEPRVNFRFGIVLKNCEKMSSSATVSAIFPDPYNATQPKIAEFGCSNSKLTHVVQFERATSLQMASPLRNQRALRMESETLRTYFFQELFKVQGVEKF